MSSMALKKGFISKFNQIIPVLLLFLLIFCPIAASADAADGPGGEWKYLANGDNVYDMAVSGGYLWQGTGGGLILRNLSTPMLYRHFHPQNSDLKGNRVFAIAPDGQGGVWLGTDQGASHRNTGGGWTHYNKGNSLLPAGAAVQVIQPDGKGGIWFGTWQGGACHLGADKQWQRFDTDNSGLPGNNIYAIAVDGRGGTWFGVDGRGAAYLGADGNWQLFNVANCDLPVNDVLDIAVDGGGFVWFGTYLGLACLEEGIHWQSYTAENSGLPADQVSALALAEDGSLWVAAGSGVACIKGGQVVHAYTKENSKLPDAVVKSLDIDGQGRVWAGTWGGGVACLNPDEGTWAVYNHETVGMPGAVMLPSNTVNTVLPGGVNGAGEAGVVWFGTDRGAVSLSLKDGVWGKNLPLAIKSDGEPAQVRQISRAAGGGSAGGNLAPALAFALDGGGLATMDNKGGLGKRYYEDGKGLPSNAVVGAAYDDDGGLWVATMGGGAAYLSGSGKWDIYNMSNSGISSDYVNCVLPLPGGKVLFGTWEGGASVYDTGAKTWMVYNAANSSLPLNDVRCLAAGQDDGTIWLGTWGAGLARLDGLGKWSLYSTKNGLPSDIIRSAALDADGGIWVATPAGAAYLGSNTNTWKVLRSGDTGLPTDDPLQVVCDRGGNVWFSTSDCGVAVYNPQGLTEDIRRLGGPVQKPEEILLYAGDKALVPEVPPLMQDGRVLVPLRVISESLGATVSWDSSSGKIEVLMENRKIEMATGSKKDKPAFIDGKPFNLDVPPLLVNGRAMVPLRFIGEGLGLDVHWDGLLRAALVRK